MKNGAILGIIKKEGHKMANERIKLKREYSMGYPGWNKVGRALRFGGSTRGHSTYRHVQKLVVK